MSAPPWSPLALGPNPCRASACGSTEFNQEPPQIARRPAIAWSEIAYDVLAACVVVYVGFLAACYSAMCGRVK